MGIKESLIKLGDADDRHWQITLSDSGILHIDNCLNIKNCDENYIMLRVFNGHITVTGTELSLESYGGRGVKICGSIHSIATEE